MIVIKSQPDTISRIKELLDNLRYLNSLPDGSFAEIDRIESVSPLSIVPVIYAITRKELQFEDQMKYASMVKVIHLPEEIGKPDSPALNKSHIPVIHFHSGNQNKQEISKFLNVLHSEFLNLLKRDIITDEHFDELITDNTFGFILGEMIDNIEEHSNAGNIYLFAQYCISTNSCEICVLDDGEGLLGSLKKAGRDVQDSQEALRKILESGLSAKTEFGTIKRGTGIKYTRLVVTNKELNGEFLIMSGNAAFLHKASGGEFFINFENYFWQGTIVMMKLYKPVSKFNLYNYVR